MTKIHLNNGDVIEIIETNIPNISCDIAFFILNSEERSHMISSNIAEKISLIEELGLDENYIDRTSKDLAESIIVKLNGKDVKFMNLNPNSITYYE